MPDPTKQTISATQSPALWNVSPYFTRWMLWQHFARGMPLDVEENARMSWGKKMQPLIIEQAAAELRLEIVPNKDDTYHRRSPLGCTRDATIICPDRGPGALETKCVFDYGVWMRDWSGGRAPPKPHDIQLQQQMYVGDPETGPYTWGVIVAWLAGELHYFERKQMPDLWGRLITEASAFLAEVKDGREPEPFGSPVELPWLNELFPIETGKSITVDDTALAEQAILYRDAKEQEAGGARAAEELRAKLLAVAKDASEIVLPDGVIVRIRPHGKGKRITVFQPGEPANLMMAG